MCVCDTSFMATDGTRIESIYEPGFGATGPQKSEDLIMVENPISVYGVKDERSSLYQDALNRGGFGDYKSKDMILFANNGEIKRDQALVAINSAINIAMMGNMYPKVMTRKNFEGGYTTSESSPIQAVDLTDSFSHTNSESGIKIPLANIVFLKRNEASDKEYEQARAIIIDKANRTLQLFGTDFRIPQFPSGDKLKGI